MKTLNIGIADYDRMKARTLAIARGEHKPARGEPTVWFTSIESFAKVLSRRNWELLETIAREKPDSLTELAELAGRSKSNLSRTLKTMSGYGLVELKRGQRRTLVPRVPYDRVSLDVSLGSRSQQAAYTAGGLRGWERVMAADSSQPGLLKSAASGLTVVAASSNAMPAEGKDGTAGPVIVATGGLLIDVADRSLKMFSDAARADLVRLTESLRENRDDYVRGVASNAMCGVVAQAIVKQFRGRSGEEAQASDLADLKRVVERWFSNAAASRQHLVPCTILPSKARGFNFGPIRFFHVSELDPKDYGLAPVESGLDVYFGPLLKMMADHAASWLAEISVEGCERNRSAEIAGLAVDVALGGLKLVIPPDVGRLMARISARTMPAFRGSFAVTDAGVEPGAANLQPGHGLPAECFEGYVGSASAEIEAMGRLIDAYLSRDGDLPELEQAWCNAAYWFHEGMLEPLDTVAMVKLETAIENLFSAASAAGSKRRMREALKSMFGIEESETVAPSSDLTYKKLVDDIVTVRSRVLHGTWPTLPGRDSGVSRSTLEEVAREFLMGYPRLLERYENELDEPADNVEALLKWAVTRGGAASESRAGTK